MNLQTIYSKFKAVATKQPTAQAIIEDDRILTYAELDLMIDSIMAKFYDQRPKYVGIIMHHGAEQIAAMLAVLKSGAAYVPAEPTLPQERINYMMQTANVELIINDNYCRHIELPSKVMPDRSIPNGVAYVLYTSGTTGKPKGVIVENHSVVNYAHAFESEFHIGSDDRMLQYSVCSFDIFVEEVFATLLNGACICIPSTAIHNGSLEGLMEFIDRHSISIVDGFPYLIAEINKLPKIPSSIKLIISGGDVIRESYITNLRKHRIKIYNTYGPSETTVCSNYYRIDNSKALEDGTFPVGKPISGVQVKILDKNLHKVPIGTTGEICIFGEGVSGGYIGNPPEQKNFVRTEDGSIMYRSGDLGYELPDGNIVFLHRRDDQIMILGKRVEPEEVENVLNTCPDIDQGIVRAFLDDNGLHYLIAYFVTSKRTSLHEIREYLASKLTDFMIPEFFVKMKHIPLTHRGKVDLNALPIVMKGGRNDD